MNHFELWAKSDPYHPLWRHLLDTGAVCEKLMECFGPPDGIPDIWAIYLAAMHDIGKADPEFQVLDDNQATRLKVLGLALPSQKGEFRHEARSGKWMLTHLQSKHNWHKSAARTAASAQRGHHGNFSPKPVSSESHEYELWDELRSQLADLIAEILELGNQPFAPQGFADHSVTGVKLIGLTVLSDWIASNEELFHYPTLDTSVNPADYWELARTEAAHAVDALRLGYIDGNMGTATNPSFRDIWPGIDTLRPSQQTLERACLEGITPGLAIIEAPMGEGKTESAVYLSEYWRSRHGCNGAYIALPTMATSNQMHGRYRKFLTGRQTVGTEPRLVHGMAWLVDDLIPEKETNTFGDNPKEERELARDWFNPSKRALIAPEGVGTIDQALMAALNVKHGFLRLMGLSSKVLIIDEVHAYDEYMTTILERLLSWCRALRIPVIMLSATLSMLQKNRLVNAYGGVLPGDGGQDIPYPLITVVPMDGSETRLLPVESQSPRTVQVKQHPGILDDSLSAAKLALELVENGGCACVLMNTVKQAQAVFQELRSLNPDGEHYLFHARFPAGRRSDIEKQVVSMFGKEAGKDGNPPRPKRAILVATQVVEQSLDLDFDVMISQLAPIDLLLQRIGRLRRHENTPRPPALKEALHILMPDSRSLEDSPAKRVYGKAILLRTVIILKDRTQFELSDDFRLLIDTCYNDECVFLEREQMIADEDNQQKKETESGKATEKLIPKPCAEIFVLDAPGLEPRDESDGPTSSYLSASTRLGAPTLSVLMLEDSGLIDVAHMSNAPGRKALKELFLHKVDIPAYWLQDAEPAEGYEAFFEGERWLRRTIVIPTRSGRWEGIRKGKPFALYCEPVMGVEMKLGRPE